MRRTRGTLHFRSAAIVGAVAAFWLLRPASAVDDGLWQQFFGTPSPVAAPPTPVERTLVDRALAELASLDAWIGIALSIALAVVLGSLLALHPRRVARRDPLKSAEDRKSLVLLALVGAAAGAIVRVEPASALVIVGLAWFVRARVDAIAPSRAVHAVLAIVVGLACGLGQFLVAVVCAVASWIVIWWLESHRNGELRIRIAVGADRQKAELVAVHELRVLRCHVRSVRAGLSGRTLTVVASVPTSLEDDAICQRLRSRLETDLGAAEVEIRSRR